MSDHKLIEYIKNLQSYKTLEEEAYHLYTCLSSKMNSPESCFVLSIAYDSMKNSRIITELIKPMDLEEGANPRETRLEYLKEIKEFGTTISKVMNINDETFAVIFKELANLEDYFIEVYTKLLKSDAPRLISNEIAELMPVDIKNVGKAFELMLAEKQKHRDTVMELHYFFKKRDEERLLRQSPAVKYQNPEGWIAQPTVNFPLSAKQGT